MRILVALLILLTPLVTQAHRFAPSALDVRALPNGEISVVWKTPAQATSNVPMLPVLPDECAVVSETVVSVRPQPGVFFQEVLTISDPVFVVPSQRSLLDTALHYLWLGAEHIAIGIDHLFFVAGLLLLVSWGRRLVYTITAFTVGHSITLALVSLGIVTNPEALIEWLIAVSIWVLAYELSKTQRKSRLWARPWYLAGGFGLLHGMGFAGALAETGLPQMHLPAALLFFNVGIELGQLIFVAFLTLVGAVVTRLSSASWLRVAPVYVLGAVSTFWVLERTGALLS